MKVPTDRDFLIQALIAISVCVGGWVIFVKPQTEALQKAEASIAKTTRESSWLSHAVFERIASQAPRLHRRAHEIQSKGTLARDSSALYSQIRTLAAEHDVQIKNVRRGPEQEKVVGTTVFVAQRVDMKVEGEFEQIARFLDSLKYVDTYLRPVSLQVSPATGGNGSFTVMQFGFESVRFNLPPSLATFVEDEA